MRNKKLYLFLLICFPLTVVASEIPAPEFLKAFYNDVDPAKMPMGLMITGPNIHNKNVKLHFVLHNSNGNRSTMDNNYANLLNTWDKNSTFTVTCGDGTNFNFAINDFAVAKVSLEHINQAVKSFVQKNPLDGTQSQKYEIQLWYLLESQLLLQAYKKIYNIENNTERLLIQCGHSKEFFANDELMREKMILYKAFGSGKKTIFCDIEASLFNSETDRDTQCAEIISYNYNLLTLPVKVSYETVMPKKTDKQQKISKTKIEQPNNRTYFYVGCSIVVLLLTFLVINKDYALNFLTTSK